MSASIEDEILRLILSLDLTEADARERLIAHYEAAHGAFATLLRYEAPVTHELHHGYNAAGDRFHFRAPIGTAESATAWEVVKFEKATGRVTYLTGQQKSLAAYTLVNQTYPALTTPPAVRVIDSDFDGVPDSTDAFPLDPTESVDTDGDGVGDNSDAFPNDPTESVDTDSDGRGDNSDQYPYDHTRVGDTDGDGVDDLDDAFPNDPTEWADSDSDGVGDNSDWAPNDPSEQYDTDGDNVGDNADAFPNDPTEWADSDSDGVGDNSDAFPNDPNETVDSDSDGVGDNADAFPNDPTETTDSDSDGVGDNADWAPNDAGITAPPVLYVDDPEAVVEGSVVSFVVRCEGGIPTGKTVSVDITTVDGTAVAGTDYTANSTTITFNPSASSQSTTFDVTTLDDGADDGDRTFTVVLSNPTEGATLGDDTAIGTVEDPPPPPPANYSEGVMEDTPLGYWKFDETSGTTATDSSGNARHGTYYGGVTSAAGLAKGSAAAATFNSTTKYVNVNTVENMPTGDFSFDCWIKVDPAHDDEATIFSRIDKPNGNVLMEVVLDYNNRIYCFANGMSFATASGYVPSDGEAHHLAVAFDAAKTGWFMWLDGVPADSGDFPVSPPWFSLTMYADDRFYVGASTEWSQTVVQKFHGIIDDFAVYSGLLTDYQAARHYSGGAVAAHDVYLATLAPLAHWEMSASTGATTETDVSGNGNTGTYFAAVSQTDGIHKNSPSAQYWPGEGTASGFSTTINPHTWTGFTFTTWYAPEINSFGKDHAMFQGYSNFRLVFNVDWTEVTAYAATDQGDVYLNLFTWQAPNLPADLFDAPHFYALRFDGASGGFSFWIDGVKFAEFIGATNDSLWSNGPLVIHTNDGTSDNKGTADTTAIWSSALSDAQILELFNKGNPA